MRGLGLGIATVFATAVFVAPAAAEPVPGLDATFGIDGIARPSAGPNPVVAGLALQPDGKVVVLASSYTKLTAFLGNSLIRLNPDGTPDPTFDGDGVVSEPAPTDSAGALALQPDGKILVGRNRLGAFTITRYNPDGSVDSGFASAGTATVNGPEASSFATVSAILVQPDGKVVAAGSAGRGDLYMARFDAAGNPDASFDSDGVMVATPPVFGSSEDEELFPEYLYLQPDGRIVVSAGYLYYTPSGDSDPPESRGGTVVTRVNPDGTLDVSFGEGGDGFATVDRGGLTSLVVNGGTRLLFGGGDRGLFDIAALSAEGTADPAFTPPEFARLSAFGAVPKPLARGFITGLAEASDGRLVAIGKVPIQNEKSFFTTQLGVAMTEPDGALIGGQRLDLGIRKAELERLAEQPDGKLITAGNIDGGLAVVRLVDPATLVCVLTPPGVFEAEERVVVAIKRLRQAKQLKQGKQREKRIKRAKQRLRDARADLRAEQAAAAQALGC